MNVINGFIIGVGNTRVRGRRDRGRRDSGVGLGHVLLLFFAKNRPKVGTSGTWGVTFLKARHKKLTQQSLATEA
jgi:hypothetical protein